MSASIEDILFESVSPENKRLRRLRSERLSLLKNWYGSDFAEVEIAAHISQPHTLQNGVRAVMAQIGTPEARALRALRDKWPEIAGAWISRVTLPLEWKDGVLFLEVRHNALLRELKPSLELLKSKVGTSFPECPCREVKLAISGGAGRKMAVGASN